LNESFKLHLKNINPLKEQQLRELKPLFLKRIFTKQLKRFFLIVKEKDSSFKFWRFLKRFVFENTII